MENFDFSCQFKKIFYNQAITTIILFKNDKLNKFHATFICIAYNYCSRKFFKYFIFSRNEKDKVEYKLLYVGSRFSRHRYY